MAAKKDNLPAKPIVSKVPLPVSDSALVIDLPDGQKLVIGKMSQGTVIEVATWRGVGRPDSRTNRMMFGMSTAEIENNSDDSDPSSQVALQPEGRISQIIGYPIAMLKWLFNIQSEPTVKKNGKKRRKLIIEPSVSAKQIESTSQDSTNSDVKNIFVINLGKFASFLKSLLRKLVEVSNFKLRSLKKLIIGGKISKSKVQNRGEVKSSQDLEFENWLASITSKSEKQLKAPSAKRPIKKKSKK